jgi:hypothetical protein
MDVMLSKAKHLAFSASCEDEILRLRLRMTPQTRGRKEEGKMLPLLVAPLEREVFRFE